LIYELLTVLFIILKNYKNKSITILFLYILLKKIEEDGW